MSESIKKFMFVNTKAPYGTVYALESLEVVLISAAFEQDVSLVFCDDGVFQITRNQNTEASGMKNFSPTYAALGDFEITKIYVEKESLEERGLTLDDLRMALTAGNSSRQAGTLVSGGLEIPVQAGVFLSGRDEVANLIVGVFNGRPVYLEDVATVRSGGDQPEQYAWYATGPAASEALLQDVPYAPAVTIAVAKKPGTNATRIADKVIERFGQLQATLIPDGVQATITRNYGKTANDKAVKLIQKLAFATASVILLVLLTIGWREAIIVGSAVILECTAACSEHGQCGTTEESPKVEVVLGGLDGPAVEPQKHDRFMPSGVTVEIKETRTERLEQVNGRQYDQEFSRVEWRNSIGDIQKTGWFADWCISYP